MTPFSLPQPLSGGLETSLQMILTEWQADRVVLTVTLTENHLNRAHIVHGGVLAAMMDVAGAYAGCYAPPQFATSALTLNLNVSYTGQASGGTLTAVAVKQGGGRQTFFSGIEIRDEAGRLIAFGQGTYRYRHPSTSDPTDLVAPDIGC